MILKERDEKPGEDSDFIRKAGAAAERQMAFYLRRAFVDDPDVLVLNDIRLEVDDGEVKDAVQIDHLMIHRHGLIIVESKSCAGAIEVNELGEWSRVWSGKKSGMASPVQQARMQANLLRKALNACADEMLGKIFLGKFQKYFGKCPIEILVGVSDRGVIDRKFECPELCKADQVPDRIRNILARHKKAASTFRSNLLDGIVNSDGLMDFGAEERRKMANFLIEHHAPMHQGPPPQPPVRTCPKCGKALVKRTAKKGARAGGEFWGCAGYPACRFIENID
jgi:hypothetical protein